MVAFASKPIPSWRTASFESAKNTVRYRSLNYDRTIQTFAKIAQDVGADSLPHHYAILACPADLARKAKLEQRLADAHISAIWYPEGEHNYVEQLLELLTY
jgi:hypothetical protein